MSTTVTLSMAPVPASSQFGACPSCGESALLEAQKQIEDLQAQVRLLNQKAAAAVDKWADYEDEIHKLRQQTKTQSEARVVVDEEQCVSSPTRTSYLPIQNRLSSFLTSRKSTPNLQPPPSPSIPHAEDLAAALTKEQQLRQATEAKLEETNGQIENLTVELFERANEMVATERKERAKLEARIEVLEKRDVEKRKRLDKLEGALMRIERVRGLLAP